MKAYVGHFEIPVRDPKRAAEFFRHAFGWRAEAVAWDGPAYVKLRSPVDGGERAIQGGLLAASDGDFDQPLPVLHLSEGTLEDCLARVKAAGGTVIEPPRPVGDFGRFARFRDPEGHAWGVWSADG